MEEELITLIVEIQDIQCPITEILLTRNHIPPIDFIFFSSSLVNPSGNYNNQINVRLSNQVPKKNLSIIGQTLSLNAFWEIWEND